MTDADVINITIVLCRRVVMLSPSSATRTTQGTGGRHRRTTDIVGARLVAGAWTVTRSRVAANGETFLTLDVLLRDETRTYTVAVVIATEEAI